MSQTRHSFLFAPNGRRIAQMAGGSWEFEHGYAIRQHSHREDQLLFASEGVMTVETSEGVWVVPPLRAVWIPAETAHGVSMSGRVSMRTLYFLPKLCSTLPRRCLVTNISSLLRELILHACQLRTLHMRVAPERHVICCAQILVNLGRSRVCRSNAGPAKEPCSACSRTNAACPLAAGDSEPG
jgi:hypothetical protein